MRITIFLFHLVEMHRKITAQDSGRRDHTGLSTNIHRHNHKERDPDSFIASSWRNLDPSPCRFQTSCLWPRGYKNTKSRFVILNACMSANKGCMSSTNVAKVHCPETSKVDVDFVVLKSGACQRNQTCSVNIFLLTVFLGASFWFLTGWVVRPFVASARKRERNPSRNEPY